MPDSPRMNCKSESIWSLTNSLWAWGSIAQGSDREWAPTENVKPLDPACQPETTWQFQRCAKCKTKHSKQKHRNQTRKSEMLNVKPVKTCCSISACRWHPEVWAIQQHALAIQSTSKRENSNLWHFNCTPNHCHDSHREHPPHTQMWDPRPKRWIQFSLQKQSKCTTNQRH